MNPYLTHQMALSNQQELHRQADRARAVRHARAAAGDSRFATLYRRVLSTHFAHPQPQTQNPAPQVGVISEA
jgi:hypothetical protein